MANPSKGLGRGLAALLGDDVMTPEEEKTSLYLPISQVESCASQPRKQFDPDALADLADSIREHGIIQPLTVRKLQSGYYQIIAGERRWRAARMAGLSEVPAIVIEADDRKAMELAMIENLQREDLNPMEEAEGYQTLMQQYNMTQEETAQRVGKSRSTVANAMRLLKLCPPRAGHGGGRAALQRTRQSYSPPLPCHAGVGGQRHHQGRAVGAADRAAGEEADGSPPSRSSRNRMGSPSIMPRSRQGTG
mgnify:CR=1 FL=1